MSYQRVVQGLVECFEGVPGLGVGRVLDYEPTSISPEPGRPVMYLLLDNVQRVQTGQVAKMEYSILCRLCFLWVDNEQAERELMPFVNLIPAAIDADPVLSTRLQTDGAGYTGGYARLSGTTAVFVSIGGVIYRALDFTATAFEKFSYRLAGL